SVGERGEVRILALGGRRRGTVPVRKAAGGIRHVRRIIARKGGVVSREAVGDDDREVLLAAVLNGTRIAGVAVVIARHAAEVPRDLVQSLRQRRIGDGTVVRDRAHQRRGAGAAGGIYATSRPAIVATRRVERGETDPQVGVVVD